jgi:hypothetical protein
MAASTFGLSQSDLAQLLWDLLQRHKTEDEIDSLFKQAKLTYKGFVELLAVKPRSDDYSVDFLKDYIRKHMEIAKERENKEVEKSRGIVASSSSDDNIKSPIATLPSSMAEDVTDVMTPSPEATTIMMEVLRTTDMKTLVERAKGIHLLPSELEKLKKDAKDVNSRAAVHALEVLQMIRQMNERSEQAEQAAKNVQHYEEEHHIDIEYSDFFRNSFSSAHEMAQERIKDMRKDCGPNCKFVVHYKVQK